MVESKRTPRGEKEPVPCVFCLIGAGKAESSAIAETELSNAFMSLEGYPLVIPKKHVTSETISGHVEELADAYKLALSLISPTKEGLHASGISLATNIGKSAGQEVDHIHIHLINRNIGDKKVSYVRSEPIPRQALDERAQEIQRHMSLLSSGERM